MLHLTQQCKVSLNSVSFLVLDEADRLLDVRPIYIE
jgi:superfamily II DNA/RNA helicase